MYFIAFAYIYIYNTVSILWLRVFGPCEDYVIVRTWSLLQLAYWRLNRESAATYESCSTSAFRRGRTETVRPLTMATKHACQLFDQPDVSPADLYSAMNECTKVHNQLTKEAAMGESHRYRLFHLARTQVTRSCFIFHKNHRNCQYTKKCWLTYWTWIYFGKSGSSGRRVSKSLCHNELSVLCCCHLQGHLLRSTWFIADFIFYRYTCPLGSVKIMDAFL